LESRTPAGAGPILVPPNPPRANHSPAVRIILRPIISNSARAYQGGNSSGADISRTTKRAQPPRRLYRCFCEPARLIGSRQRRFDTTSPARQLGATQPYATSEVPTHRQRRLTIELTVVDLRNRVCECGVEVNPILRRCRAARSPVAQHYQPGMRDSCGHRVGQCERGDTVIAARRTAIPTWSTFVIGTNVASHVRPTGTGIGPAAIRRVTGSSRVIRLVASLYSRRIARM